MKPRHIKTDKGFTLFEMILALGIFTLGAVSLLTALNIVGLTTHEAKQRSNLNRQIASVLNETCFQKDLKEDVIDIPHNDNVLIQVSIQEADLSSEENGKIDGIFLVTVIAKDKSGTEINRVERYVNHTFWASNR